MVTEAQRSYFFIGMLLYLYSEFDVNFIISIMHMHRQIFITMHAPYAHTVGPLLRVCQPSFFVFCTFLMSVLFVGAFTDKKEMEETKQQQTTEDTPGRH